MKTISIEGVGEIALKKSRRAKRLILKANHDGSFSITVPYYVPYYAAEQFAKRQKIWLQQHSTHTAPVVFRTGMRIGRTHVLHFTEKPQATKPSARVTGDSISVSYPPTSEVTTPEVQQTAKKAAVRALKKQAEVALPTLLHQLSTQYGYPYKEVRIKTMRSRWGSCSSGKVINLSIWLMQLPEELVRYVLCHELAHLTHMNHSKAFWLTVEAMDPAHKQHRKALKEYQPLLLQT
ncbi:M48 family peptidase [Patescibacteria group bacterium]|nr:MAG: M48 family peptidase [Patescibacteria group bacterium]